MSQWTNLLTGNSWSLFASTITYSFINEPPAESDYYDSEDNLTIAGFSSTPNFSGFLEAQQEVVDSLLEASGGAYRVSYSDTVNVTFAGMSGIGRMTFGRGEMPASTSALAIQPPVTSATNEDDWHGDVWLSSASPANGWNDDAEAGQYGYWNILHEIGHAFGGLKDALEATGLTSTEDSQQYTVMSYNPAGWVRDHEDIFEFTPKLGGNELYWDDGETPLFAYSLGLYDIAALQSVYGANTTTRNTNTAYSLANGGLGRDGDDDKAFLYTVWDGGGTDTINASGFNAIGAVKIDLREGHFSSIGSNGNGQNGYEVDGSGNVTREIQNVAIAYGAVIENATGTSNNDHLIGNDYNNTLSGADGNDILEGSGGYNILDGGDDDDTFIINADVSSYSVVDIGSFGDIETLNITGDVAVGDLYLLESVPDYEFHNGYHHGGTASLLQIGTYQFDENGKPISAPSFIDIQASVGGVSFFDNIDTLKINGAPITVSEIANAALKIGYTFGSYYEGTYEYDIKEVQPQYTAEHSRTTTGTSGRDWVRHEDGGYDILVGGDDDDILWVNQSYESYQPYENGPHISVTVYGYEVYAGDGNDRVEIFSGLTTSSPGGLETYNIDGREVYLGDGNDELTGGQGLVYGGAGNDAISIKYGEAYGEAGNDLLWAYYADDGVYLDGGDGNDSIDGSSYGDTLVDDDGHNSISGYGGNDTITSGAGNDYISGGDGDDTIDSGTGNDYLSGDQGDDVYIVGGTATIYEGDDSGGYDTITYSGGSTMYRRGNDLFIESTSGHLIIINQFSNANSERSIESITGLFSIISDEIITVGTEANETISGANYGDASPDDEIYGFGGNDSIDGGNGNDIIDGGAGNDSLRGAAGDDVFIQSSGLDVIIDSSGTDEIIFLSDTTAAMVTTVRVSDDLRVFVAGLHAFTIYDHYVSGSQIEVFSFSGGSSFTVPISDLTGTSGVDTLNGTSASEFIHGLAGNDTISGGSGDDHIYAGDGDDAITSGIGNDIFNGGTGMDGLSYASAAAGVTVNLATGTASDGDGGTDGIADIENITGSAYNDTITGNSASNSLIGGAGDDTLNGGDGIDTVSYSAAAAGVDVNIATGVVSDDGDGGEDALSSIENVIGSAYNDNIIGNGSDNILSAGVGNDILSGGAGNDTLSGGDGTDTASYSSAGAAVTVNLSTGAASDGDGGTDTLSSIENVIGSTYNDTIIGNSGNNTFDGGDGIDTVNYSSATDAIDVDLATGVADDGDGGTDTLSNIENIVGSVYNDNIIGNSNANILSGGQGEDTLEGGDGDDTLIGSSGDDDIDGGNGLDAVDYSGAGSGVDVSLWGSAYDGDGGLDTLTSIEKVYGSAYADAIAGNSGANILIGNAGNDTLNAAEGDDTLEGGAGDDDIQGNLGVDTAIYTSATSSVTVDLITGTASDGLGGTDTISGIEIVIASSYNDSIIGNASDNTLVGGAGDDTFVDGYGADIIDGGDGIDTILYQQAGANINLATGVVSDDGNSGTDTLIDIENVSGSSYADIIVGSAAANIISGNGGNDILSGGAGNDTLDGGSGTDTVSYASAAAAITINLSTGTASDGDGGTDTLSYIEDVVGSAYNDTITGDSEANSLFGGSGNDYLAGGSGENGLDGGDGNDIFSLTSGAFNTIVDSSGSDEIQFYNGATSGNITTTRSGNDMLVYVSAVHIATVTDHFTTNGRIETFRLYDNSTLTAPQEITGTSGNDTINGTGFSDTIHGLAGNDTINGGAGNDHIYGNAGDDVIDGGDGVDTAYYTTGVAYINLDLGYAAGSDGEGGIDTIINVENIVGSAYDDFIDGNSSANTLWGGAGGDVITGYTGDDILYGEDGADYLWGNEGNDTLYGGAGNDPLYGLEGNDTLYGGDGNDSMRGDDASSDSGFSGAGNDILYGGVGNDVMAGGAGNDILYGDDGVDTLYGNAGDDIFAYNSAALNTTSHDVISDFALADDVLDLGDILTNYVSGTSDVDDYVKAVNIASTHTRIQVDIDGTGSTYSWMNLVQIQNINTTTFGTVENAVTNGIIVL